MSTLYQQGGCTVTELGEEQARALLAELVRIPSINPLEGRGPAEAQIAEFVAGWLDDAGVEVEMPEILPGRRNVIARVRGLDPQRVLLLENHLDTVGIERMSIAPFKAEVVNGKLYGRGASDAKGSLAAFMLALRALVERGVQPAQDLVLAAVCDGEHKNRGIIHCLDSWSSDRGITAAVVGLPTKLRLVTAHKGWLRFQVRTLGRSAHTAHAWEGENAIEQMADVLDFIRDQLVPELLGVEHPLVGQPALAVTRIRGGRDGNVVPDEALLTLNRWTIPGEDGMKVWSRYKVQIEAIAPGKVEVQTPQAVKSPLQAPCGASIAMALRQILEERGLPAEPQGGDYGSEAGRLSTAGIPAVLFGPGSASNAHHPAESIELAQVAAAANIMIDLASRFRG
jgi:acetylornithine deacetylase